MVSRLALTLDILEGGSSLQEANCPFTTPHHRSFSLQQMKPITENHNCMQCSDQQVVGSPAPKSTLCITAPASEHDRRGGRKIASQNTGKCAVKQSLLNMATQTRVEQRQYRGQAATEGEVFSWGTLCQRQRRSVTFLITKHSMKSQQFSSSLTHKVTQESHGHMASQCEGREEEEGATP